MQKQKRYQQRPAYGRPGRRRHKVNANRFTAFLAVCAAVTVGVVLLVMFITGSGLFRKKGEVFAEPTATPIPFEQPQPSPAQETAQEQQTPSSPLPGAVCPSAAACF